MKRWLQRKLHSTIGCAFGFHNCGGIAYPLDVTRPSIPCACKCHVGRQP